MGVSGCFSHRRLVVTGALTDVKCYSLLALDSLNFASKAMAAS